MIVLIVFINFNFGIKHSFVWTFSDAILYTFCTHSVTLHLTFTVNTPLSFKDKRLYLFINFVILKPDVQFNSLILETIYICIIVCI